MKSAGFRVEKHCLAQHNEKSGSLTDYVQDV